jgi:hypothetical protein
MPIAEWEELAHLGQLAATSLRQLYTKADGRHGGEV